MPRLRRSHSYRRVTIAAGDSETRAWCPVCQLPIRVRVPLHSGSRDGPVVSVLEICPGCGSGHDEPSVAVTEAPRERRHGHPLARLTRAIHGWRCRRRGLLPLACAFGDCEWPGLYRHEHAVDGDEGTWRYVFCRPSHQRRWAAEYGIVLTPPPVKLTM